MKLTVTLEPEDKSASGLIFDVDIPKKQFNIAKESAKLITSVTTAIKNIKNEVSQEE